MPYLNFITDQDLLAVIQKIIQKIKQANQAVDLNLSKNILDPFSALFDGITHGISYEEWLRLEKTRQIQKTMQNAIGDFHQDILGKITGCENLGNGGGLDVVNRRKKIVAEIKNKFNTTKGNHRTEIYDAIREKLKTTEFRGFTGYYVEVISRNRKIYDQPFVPSDNKTSKKRVANKAIRVIDGQSFYQLMSGDKLALQKLFTILPQVISDNFGYKLDKKDLPKYLQLFAEAFKTK